MKNYNELLKKSINIEEVKKVVELLNADIRDNNNDFNFDFVSLKNVVDNINETNKNDFTKHFCYEMSKDRQNAFVELLASPCFDTYSIKIEDNGTYTIKDNTRLFSFVNLEKGYRTFKSTDNDKNGKPILNKSVTIFDALRFYGLMSVFIRNLQKSNFEIDKDNSYNLENVMVDNEKVFADIDGKIFASNSNNMLEKQLNVIVKFFGYDVQMLKKDLPILKIKAQKIKQDKQNANFSINAIIDDNSVLKFADVVFGVITTRINGKDIDIITKKPTIQND